MVTVEAQQALHYIAGASGVTAIAASHHRQRTSCERNGRPRVAEKNSEMEK